jgi:hypothetical protein
MWLQKAYVQKNLKQKGVKQGDAVSTTLFNLAFQMAMTTMTTTSTGTVLTEWHNV